MSAVIEQRNQDATCYVGNLAESVSEDLLWELMIQAGPVTNVFMPKDKMSGAHQGFGFVEFRTEPDAEYAMKIMNTVKLYGNPLKVNKASQDKKLLDIGANLFIGGLDREVDDKLLYDTFSAFGGINGTPKVMYDPDTGLTKGYGFVNYDSFDASDMAIECMNGQYLAGRQIVVQYAFKKDGAGGERHGTEAERRLAKANAPVMRPHTMFSSGPGGMMPAHATGGPPPPHMGSNMGAPPPAPRPPNMMMMPPRAPHMPPHMHHHHMVNQHHHQQQQQQHQQQQPPPPPPHMHMMMGGRGPPPPPGMMQPPPPPPPQQQQHMMPPPPPPQQQQHMMPPPPRMMMGPPMAGSVSQPPRPPPMAGNMSQPPRPPPMAGNMSQPPRPPPMMMGQGGYPGGGNHMPQQQQQQNHSIGGPPPPPSVHGQPPPPPMLYSRPPPPPGSSNARPPPPPRQRS